MYQTFPHYCVHNDVQVYMQDKNRKEEEEEKDNDKNNEDNDKKAVSSITSHFRGKLNEWRMQDLSYS